ncbi:hypothetical protein AX17_006600 [Amanita inopinata Kibby_2008]|nr:hypothetical protein AX17_006600 [Amanita inopinata Kibby_2008]
MLSARSFLTCSRQFFAFQSRRRCLATWGVDPSIQEFTTALAKRQPKFLIPPNNVRVLSQPRRFYALLLDMIGRAEKRIFLSSLYIGSSESELISNLDAALRRNPELQLFLQLDLNRSTRPGPSSTAKILLPLLRDFPSRVHVSMFRSPALRGLAAKIVPPRFNEGWGTWHAKIYGVDNEVLISGANLNKSYFTNRQDRYVHLRGNHDFAQYCFNFLQTVSTFSFKLLPSNPQKAINEHSISQGDYTLHWPDPETHPHYIHRKAQQALSAFQTSQFQLSMTKARRPIDNTTEQNHQPDVIPAVKPDVMLFPVIQAGQFRVHEEETALQLLFRCLDTFARGKPISKRPNLDLTSGYFGLYRLYLDLILKSSNIDTRIVCSAPKANGFFGSKGISGRIPEGYTYLEQRFMSAVHKNGRLWSGGKSGKGMGVRLSEWERHGWTYHAKGIWLSPSADSLPVLTMFGSTNLNSRSAHLDTELSFLMVIPSQLQTGASDEARSKGRDIQSSMSPESDHADVTEVGRQLRTEIDGIREHVVDWKGAKRKVRFLTKAIVLLVKGML